MMAKINELCVDAAAVSIGYASAPQMICLLTGWDARGWRRVKVRSLDSADGSDSWKSASGR